VAGRPKKKKEDSPRYAEIRLMNRVTGEVVRQLLDRTRASADPGSSLGTAGWLAGSVAVSESTLSRLLSGSNSPAFATIWFAAEALGLRPSQLVSVIEDAMQRVEGLELSASELVARIASGELTEEELDELLRSHLAAAIDESDREPELWELIPEEDVAQGTVEGSSSRWSRMLASPVTSSVVTAVLGAAAGVAAGRFFGSDSSEAEPG
jgi:transcriptional regulator with XRE-family HTH domain